MRKRTFEASLNTFFDSLKNDKPQKEVLALTERVAAELRSACSIADSQLAARKVLDLERQAQADMRDLETRYRISASTNRIEQGHTTRLGSVQRGVCFASGECIQADAGYC